MIVRLDREIHGRLSRMFPPETYTVSLGRYLDIRVKIRQDDGSEQPYGYIGCHPGNRVALLTETLRFAENTGSICVKHQTQATFDHIAVAVIQEFTFSGHDSILSWRLAVGGIPYVLTGLDDCEPQS